MNKLILIYLTIFIPFFGYSQSNFTNFNINFGPNEILQNCTWCGQGYGGYTLNITNDVLTVNMSGRTWNPGAFPKEGEIFVINTTPQLPDMELGILSFEDDNGIVFNNYSAFIEDGKFVIKKVYPLSYPYVNTLDFNFKVELTNSIKVYSPSSDLGSDVFLSYEFDNQQNHIIPQDKLFFDGLGRFKQSLQIQADPTFSKNLISQSELDMFGRNVKNYLPYAKPVNYSNKDEYDNNFETSQEAFYQSLKDYVNGSFAFSEYKYSDDPKSNLIESSSEGRNWSMSQGYKNQLSYKSNNANEVRDLGVSNTSSIIDNGYYASGELNLTEKEIPLTSSSNANAKIFQNKSGQLVLIRLLADDPNYQYRDMYMIYDDFGRLKFMIQPEGMNEIYQQNNWSLLNSSSFISKWCFKYTHNKRGEIITKKVPSQGLLEIVYDDYDHVVMTRDANQKYDNGFQWSVYLYDKFNRPILKGTNDYYTEQFERSEAEEESNQGNLQVQKSRGEVQLLVDLDNINFGTENASGLFGYSDDAVQINNAQINHVFYYDNYNFDRIGNPDFAYIPDPENHIQINNLNSPSPFGFLTGEFIFNLEDNSKFKRKIYFYDTQGRVVQQISDNELGLSGEIDIDYFVYNFNGQLVRHKHVHRYSNSNSFNLIVDKKYTFDKRGRLLAIKSRINDDPEIILTSYEYNDIGELIRKNVHSEDNGNNYLQNIDYKYNVKGWLIAINNIQYENCPVEISDPVERQIGTQCTKKDLFALQLNYDETFLSPFNAVARFDGNPSLVEWQSLQDNVRRRYGYTYDHSQRLTAARYAAYNCSERSWSDELNFYSIPNITYDANGNILTLKRRNLYEKNGLLIPDLTDNLTYTYDGNNLLSIDDNSIFDGLNGFKNLSSAVGNGYSYDNNGNVTSNIYKNVTYQLNLLNQYSQVSFDTENLIDFDFDASGSKWSKTFINQGSQVNQTQYHDNFIYRNGLIDFISNEEGRVVLEDSDIESEWEFRYEYLFLDQVGNVRLRYSDLDRDGCVSSDEILEENSYYPYGLKHLGLNHTIVGGEMKYRFNSKEFNDENVDLDNDNVIDGYFEEYDHGARMFDPSIARWNVVDPISETQAMYSPYHFTYNNPISFSDPTGLEGDDVKNKNNTGTKTSVYVSDGKGGGTWKKVDKANSGTLSSNSGSNSSSNGGSDASTNSSGSSGNSSSSSNGPSFTGMAGVNVTSGNAPSIGPNDGLNLLGNSDILGRNTPSQIVPSYNDPILKPRELSMIPVGTNTRDPQKFIFKPRIEEPYEPIGQLTQIGSGAIGVVGGVAGPISKAFAGIPYIGPIAAFGPSIALNLGQSVSTGKVQSSQFVDIVLTGFVYLIGIGAALAGGLLFGIAVGVLAGFAYGLFRNTLGNSFDRAINKFFGF